MAEITLDELLTETKVRPERLDKGISDDHLCEIALFLTSWRTVASHLKLKEIDLDAVEREGKDEQEKRLKALQKWRGKFAFKATYRKLVEVLLSLGMADVAEKICCLLKGSYRYMGEGEEGVYVHTHVWVGVRDMLIVSQSVSQSNFNVPCTKMQPVQSWTYETS